jgi:tRNA (cmo5U34)-methyltransferase
MYYRNRHHTCNSIKSIDFEIVMNKSVEIFEGERARNYDNFVIDYFPSYSFVMQNCAVLISDNLMIKSKPKILVVGCGTGTEVEELLDYNNDWLIDACDPSEEMFNQSKYKLSNYTNVNLIHGGVDELHKSDLYDAATLFLVLHFISDDGAKLDVLKEIANRLEVGAKFLLLDICGTQTEIEENFDILRQLLPKEWPNEEIELRRERILKTLNTIDEKRTLELLELAGFVKPVKWHQSFLVRSWILNKA